MKRLNLDETWKQGLMMWRWIAMRVKAGDERNVFVLKAMWLEKHGIENNEIDYNCFFCEYDSRYRDDCDTCPAKRVNKLFHCNDSDTNYACYYQPIAFYT